MEKCIFQVLPVFKTGGAEIMAEHLILELKKNNYKVIPISLYNVHTDLTRRIEEKGVNIIYLDKKKGLSLEIILSLRKLIKKYNPDVIHTHLYVLEYVILASLGKKVKIIHTVHNIANKEVSGLRRLLRQVIFRLKKVTPVSISPLIQESLSKQYHINHNKFPIVYNGIDLNKCIPKTNYEFKEVIQFLNIGRLEEQKNQINLIKAIKNIKDNDNLIVNLDIIGEGSLKEELKKLINNLKLSKQVRIIGEKSSVYDDLNKADAFILPSKWEGMPISIIEAMGTGLPIIASGVGGVKNMIENGKSGLICQPDINSIEIYIKKIVNMSSNKRAELGKNAMKKSESFSAKEMCKRYINLY